MSSDPTSISPSTLTQSSTSIDNDLNRIPGHNNRHYYDHSGFAGLSPSLQLSSGTTPIISDSTVPSPDISAPVAGASQQFPERRDQQQQQQQQQRQGHGSKQDSTHLNSRSCVTCRRRKIRCNKKSPCSNCAKVGVECVFPAPGRARRRSKRSSDVQLHSRLRRLESVIEHLHVENNNNSNTNTAGYVNTNADTPTSPIVAQQSPRRDDDAAGINNDDGPREKENGCIQAIINRDPKNPGPRAFQNELGRLVVDHDRSRYVSNRFWASLGDEVEELQDVLDPTSSDESDYPSPSSSSAPSSNGDGFLFGYSSLAHSLRKYHPSPAHIPILWSAYEENVAPVLTFLHKPTTKKLVMEASTDLSKLDKNSEALVLTIYFTAVITMSAEDCWSRLGEHRSVAVGRYRFATEQALARANFLNTQNLTLLQAAVLFLFCVRPEDDTRFVWSMTAVVLRLAQGLGLHRDGTNFGLKPFETEMRRRLWWHICLLDIRSAEEHGTDTIVQERMHDVQLPLNINDDDLSPEMVDAPQEHVGCSEMTFTLARCEMTLYLRQVSYFCPGGWLIFGRGKTSVEESEKWIRSINKHLEERYIKHCDQNVPIYWLCAIVTRVITAKLWLAIHYPMARCDREPTLPHVPRHSLLLTAVEMIEFTILLKRHESTAKWSWITHVYMQWQAIAFILSEICVRPICPLTERAWVAVSALYEEWEKNAKRKKGMMWRPIKRLMRRAAAVRARLQEELQAKHGDQSTIPPQHSQYISPFQLGSDLYSTPMQFLPRIYVPRLDGVSTSTQREGTATAAAATTGTAATTSSSTGQTQQYPRLDDSNPDQITPPYGASNGLLLSQNTLGGTNLFAPVMPIQQQPYPTGMSACSGAYEDAMATIDSPQGWTADMDVDWAEWDKVMREFQMDVEREQSIYPMGNFPIGSPEYGFKDL